MLLILIGILTSLLAGEYFWVPDSLFDLTVQAIGHKLLLTICLTLTLAYFILLKILHDEKQKNRKIIEKPKEDERLKLLMNLTQNEKAFLIQFLDKDTRELCTNTDVEYDTAKTLEHIGVLRYIPDKSSIVWGQCYLIENWAWTILRNKSYFVNGSPF